MGAGGQRLTLRERDCRERLREEGRLTETAEGAGGGGRWEPGGGRERELPGERDCRRGGGGRGGREREPPGLPRESERERESWRERERFGLITVID